MTRCDQVAKIGVGGGQIVQNVTGCEQVYTNQVNITLASTILVAAGHQTIWFLLLFQLLFCLVKKNSKLITYLRFHACAPAAAIC